LKVLTGAAVALKNSTQTVLVLQSVQPSAVPNPIPGPAGVFGLVSSWATSPGPGLVMLSASNTFPCSRPPYITGPASQPTPYPAFVPCNSCSPPLLINYHVAINTAPPVLVSWCGKLSEFGICIWTNYCDDDTHLDAIRLQWLPGPFGGWYVNPFAQPLINGGTDPCDPTNGGSSYTNSTGDSATVSP